jgi:hypothetical protein
VVHHQVEPAQKALIVTRLKLVQEAKGIPNWSEHMAQFALTAKERMEEELPPFPWDYDGRHLGLTWYGGYGIGANDWREADAVLLFDEYHLPQRLLVAMAQGLMGCTAADGVIATHPARPQDHPLVKELGLGHLRRWLKQMALRGKAREFDAQGICGEQKLIVIGDLITLIENFELLFPSASLRHEVTAADEQVQHLTQLALVLMRPELPDTISTKMIGELMGVEWRKVSSDLKRHPSWRGLLKALRWDYAPVRGRAGGSFKRIGSPTADRQ